MSSEVRDTEYCLSAQEGTCSIEVESRYAHRDVVLYGSGATLTERPWEVTRRTKKKVRTSSWKREHGIELSIIWY